MSNTHARTYTKTVLRTYAHCSHKLYVFLYSWCLFACWLCVHNVYEMYAIPPKRGYLCVCVSLEIGTDPCFVFCCCFFPSRPFLYLSIFSTLTSKQALCISEYVQQYDYFVIERSETEDSVLALCVHNQFRRHWANWKPHFLFIFCSVPCSVIAQSIQLMWRVSVGHLNLWCYYYNGKLIKISSYEMERSEGGRSEKESTLEIKITSAPLLSPPTHSLANWRKRSPNGVAIGRWPSIHIIYLWYTTLSLSHALPLSLHRSLYRPFSCSTSITQFYSASLEFHCRVAVSSFFLTDFFVVFLPSFLCFFVRSSLLPLRILTPLQDIFSVV